jgi:hypothetical protein
MKSLANLYAFFMGGRAHYKLEAHMKGHWASCDLRENEVSDHAGFSLHPDRDIVIRCLLGIDKSL